MIGDTIGSPVGSTVGHSPRRSDAGFALMHAAFFLTVLTLAIMVVTTARLQRTQSQLDDFSRTQAQYAAEAGTHEAMAALAQGSFDTRFDGELSRAHYTVQVDGVGTAAVTIRATGVHRGRERRLEIVGAVIGTRFVMRSWK